MPEGDNMTANGGLFAALFPNNGEVGAFRVLKYLFDKDDCFRRVFLEWIETQLGLQLSLTCQLPTIPSSLELEWPVDNELAREGRMDGWIDGGEYAIVVEGKFGASFQATQLTRYQNWLVNENRQPSKVLLVIVPNRRRNQVEKLEHPSMQYVCSTWEKLLACLDSLTLPAPELNCVLSHWRVFVKYLCQGYEFGNAPDWFTKGQTEAAVLINAVYQLLEDDRYEFVRSVANNWGYSFGYRLLDHGPKGKPNAWVGVVRNGILIPRNPELDDDHYVLTLATNFEVKFGDNPAIKCVGTKEQKWRHEQRFYVIQPSKLEEDQKTEMAWREMLRPFREQVVAELCQR